MKNLVKKKKRIERFFAFSLVALTISLFFLFACMLETLHYYFPGCEGQEEMIAKALITLGSSALFGFFTAKTLNDYCEVLKRIDLYKQGQKNKMNEL